MEAPQPQSCTLEGPDLVVRMEAWREVVEHATSRRVEEGRVIATYPKDAQLLDRLRALVVAEAECCSFLDFTLEERADAVVITLQVPDGLEVASRARIRELFGG